MKKVKKKLILLFVVVVISSCSNKRFLVAPEFTDVDKISILKKGMTIDEVNKVLGISPYDAFNFDMDKLLLSYNYRLKERRIPITNLNKYVNMYEDPASNSVNSESAQVGGTVYYSDWKKLYVKFSNGELSGYISDEGLENANMIEVVRSSINQYNKNGNVKIIDHDIPGSVYFVDSLGNFHANPGFDTRHTINSNSNIVKKIFKENKNTPSVSSSKKRR